MTINTKYSIGDQVYFIHRDAIIRKTIAGLTVIENNIGYMFIDFESLGLNPNNYIKIKEDQCFLSIEDLGNYYKEIIDRKESTEDYITLQEKLFPVENFLDTHPSGFKINDTVVIKIDNLYSNQPYKINSIDGDRATLTGLVDGKYDNYHLSYLEHFKNEIDPQDLLDKDLSKQLGITSMHLVQNFIDRNHNISATDHVIYPDGKLLDTDKETVYEIDDIVFIKDPILLSEKQDFIVIDVFEPKMVEMVGMVNGVKYKFPFNKISLSIKVLENKTSTRGGLPIFNIKTKSEPLHADKTTEVYGSQKDPRESILLQEPPHGKTAMVNINLPHTKENIIVKGLSPSDIANVGKPLNIGDEVVIKIPLNKDEHQRFKIINQYEGFTLIIGLADGKHYEIPSPRLKFAGEPIISDIIAQIGDIHSNNNLVTSFRLNNDGIKFEINDTVVIKDPVLLFEKQEFMITSFKHGYVEMLGLSNNVTYSYQIEKLHKI